MLNKNIKNTLIIISIILIGIGIYYGNKNIISDEKKIENAFNNTAQSLEKADHGGYSLV